MSDFPPITPPQPTITFPSSAPPDKPSLKPFVIPAIILAILIPSLIILFQVRNSSGSAQTGPNISQVKFPTPSPLPPKSGSDGPESTTSAWTVYKNPDYNYTLRYPPTLTIQEIPGQFESTRSASQKVSMTSFSDKDQNTFNIFFEGEFNRGIDPNNLEETTIATISGYPATKQTYSLSSLTSKLVFLTIPNFHSFRIEIQGSPDFLNLANRIIDTFKFAN